MPISSRQIEFEEFIELMARRMLKDDGQLELEVRCAPAPRARRRRPYSAPQAPIFPGNGSFCVRINDFYGAPPRSGVKVTRMDLEILS